jgi:hypothetical protein
VCVFMGGLWVGLVDGVLCDPSIGPRPWGSVCMHPSIVGESIHPPIHSSTHRPHARMHTHPHAHIHV